MGRLTRCDLDIEDFPTVATDWDQVVAFARDQNLNFSPFPSAKRSKESSQEIGNMPAKFLTVDEVQRQRDRAIQIDGEHVEHFYSELGTGFGKSLFLPAYELEK